MRTIVDDEFDLLREKARAYADRKCRREQLPSEAVKAFMADAYNAGARTGWRQGREFQERIAETPTEKEECPPHDFVLSHIDHGIPYCTVCGVAKTPTENEK